MKGGGSNGGLREGGQGGWGRVMGGGGATEGG